MDKQKAMSGVSKSSRPTKAKDYVVTDQVGHLIRKVHQRHTALFQHYSCDKHLTPQQFATLCILQDYGPSSLTDLVNLTAIDQATIRGVVSRLKKRELIFLDSDSKDQRKVIVNVTEQGRQLISDMIPCAKVITEKTLEKLNEPERIALKVLLNKMV